LPVSDSGLGIYNPADICSFSYIASVSQTSELQNLIVNNPKIGLPEEYHRCCRIFIDSFNNKENINLPQYTQKQLARIFFKVKRESVLRDKYITMQNIELQQRFLAILESVRQPHASAYLFVIPNPVLNQVFLPKEFRAIMALRLLIPIFSGILICNKEKCVSLMDPHGYHAVNCRGSHFARHELVVDALHYLCFEAEFHPKRKAFVKCLGHSLRKFSSTITAYRPADILLEWDFSIRKTCVDVTIVSPIKSNMPEKFIAGKDANLAEDRKYFKHESACREAGYDFIAFAADVFGVLAPEANRLLKRITTLLQAIKNYSKHVAKNIVYRKISFAIHLGVARQLVNRMEPGTFH
jgi:hypothetical protein